jgi:Ring finger domain
MRYTSILALSVFCARAAGAQNSPQQITQPSNDTSDLLPIATSPRFLLNGTELPNLPILSLAPLGPYAAITKSEFLNVAVPGQLVNVNVANSNDVQPNEFAYISCDPGAYSGYLNASDALGNVLSSQNPDVIVILYSEYSNHCNVSDLNSAPAINGVLTTTNPTAAAALANLDLTLKSNGTAIILPDLNSFWNSTGDNGSSGNGNLLGPSPTTAVAMIILYSITGIITALFIIIIITGAIRAHRHPERYGPRTVAGRMRQSRAKGIARAMLETLPIVKFGDHEDLPAKPAEGSAGTDGARDIEMNPTAGTDAATTDKAATETEQSEIASTKSAPHDGTTEDGTLGCSICTEDFTKGEEVRVLPCNHKFHPDCVDPWLLNVSGTCPLCRIDLRPEDEQNEEPAENQPAGEGSLNLPPPLSLLGSAIEASGRRGTAVGLRGIAHGTREERIAALRRYRQERRRNTSTAAGAGESEAPELQAERRGLTARLRERLRVRTTQASDAVERIQRAI